MIELERLTPLKAYDLVKTLDIGAKERRDDYKLHTDFYNGGEDAKSYLAKHPKESAKSYKRRQDRFANLNYTAALADQLIDAVYGQPWERRLIGTESQQEAWDNVVEFNRLDIQQRDWGYSQIVLGDGHARIWPDEEADALRIQPVHPTNISVLISDRDPLKEDLLIEHQAFEFTGLEQIKREEWLFWTEAEMARLGLKAGGQPRWIDEPQPNPYGLIPYAHWRGRGTMASYWCVSGIRDVVTMQRMVHNRVSMLDRVVVYQTHGQLVILSTEADKITSSEDAFLSLRPGEDAKYIQPGAAIGEVQESIERLIDRIFEVGRVPVSAVRGGSANSGFQLVMEYVPMQRLVTAYKMQAQAAEEDLIQIVARVGNVEGYDFPEELENWEISSPESFLPTDKEAEFLRELRLVQGGFMLRRDFINKWVGKGQWTDEELDEYLEKLSGESRPAPAAEEETESSILAGL